jgi:hypothetical protein
MPWRELDALGIVFQSLLDDFEQRVRLILINAYVISNGEDDLTDLLL